MKFETKVIYTIQRTRDVLSIRFERPNGFDFHPGQFMFLTINRDGEKTVKHFTISSSPTEKGFIEITKKLTGHDFSNALKELKIDEIVSVDAPYGNFTFKGEHNKVLFLTGGIGITPIRSIISCCIDEKINTDMVLIYSNTYEHNIPFKDELNDFQGFTPNLKVFYTVSKPTEKWEGYTGRIKGDMVRELVPDYGTRVPYISGPPAMVDNMVNILVNELKILSTQIKKEHFLGY
jgi:ferredoxin-NADP reductase